MDNGLWSKPQKRPTAAFGVLTLKPKFINITHMTLQEIKEKITPILKDNPIEYIGVFGSVARGEDKPDSDIDILVKFTGRPTFAGYLKLDQDLHNKLGRKIDLVTEGGVNKFLRPQIERDLKLIYGQGPNLSRGD